MLSFLPDFINEAKYVAVYLLMLVEAFIPIFPTEIVLPLAGALAAKGKMSLWLIIIAGAAGSITGATIWYGIARWLGFERFRALVVRFGWLTTVSPREIDKLQEWFLRFGTPIIFFGRFIPGIRIVVSIPAGLTAMPFPRFLALSALGSTLSLGILASAGWLLRDQYEKVEKYVGPLTTIIVGTLVAVWLVRMVLGFLKRNKA